ncbi:DUF4366 domain-containing protein [Candidatus Saccharibacteria bacterium]|nr:DUF4366 domain-containing protein [Candidatus Saccharibacteria bacterium]
MEEQSGSAENKPQVEETPPKEDNSLLDATISEDPPVESADTTSSAETEISTPESTAVPTPQPSAEPERNQVVPVEQTNTPEQPNPNPKKKKVWLIILLAVLAFVIAVGGATAYYFLVYKKKNKPSETQTYSTYDIPVGDKVLGNPTEAPTQVTGVFTYIEPVFSDKNVTWQTPSEIDLQGYYKNEIKGPLAEGETVPEGQQIVQYYLAGTFSGGKVIYAIPYFDGPGSSTAELFIKNDSDQKATLLYRYLRSYSDSYTNNDNLLNGENAQYNSDNVEIDYSTVLTGTWAPEKLTLNGQKFKLPTYEIYNNDGPTGESYSNNTGSMVLENIGKGTVFSNVNEGTVYELGSTKNGYKLSLFELELPNHFRVSYQLDGEISRSDIPPITWTDGTRNTASYKSFGYGCGGGYYSLIADVTKDQLTQIGTSDGKQPIYIFKDMTLPVAAQILSEVNARGSYDNYISESSPPYTAEEFLKDRAVIIVEDGMGRMVVFKNTGNFLEGGCAKPVVYLYPSSPTLLNVRVGADVTVSEPTYGTNGWQNVFALPNGSLTFDGKQYDSLFWEGKGQGLYPDTSGIGAVVPQSAVVATMYQQLAEQGFNQKESNDFVEFWSKNIPSGKFVRMTWLNTQQMNQLAPLYLSQQPDTLIRTFLEMDGMDSPASLMPQHFTAPTRNGFTVTEWGGLATNGLDFLNR